MTKKERLKIISEIIETEEVDNQKDLTELLVKRGYNVSQATVSRDINELNLIKGAGAGKKFRYVKGGVSNQEIPQKFIDLFKQVCISVSSANNLIVVKTLSGNAGAAGMAIDEMRFSEILGTIAGDDTLLIVAKSNSDAEIIVKGLKAL